ncbi:hypothetical protein GCM10010218_28080 [Streptomyces mashuensis]|uniref:MFS transporter n=1 Tax=Streptomyces mashuensis TaxID=33904 RepID=A0A919B3K3_9ACTN|nr:MFS transporter [Streptomyces mashuensis]GHF44966.1 hypothetical protein GCM10010218_28080 [Streptomyces mashuensis]
MRHVRLLRCRRVRVLWLSMTLSVLGDRLYALAAMWVVYDATGSSSLMGLVAAVESVPYVVVGGAGSVVAWFSCWRSLAWVDAVRALVAAALPLLWSPDPAGLTLLLVMVLLLGTLSAVFDPNLGALIPQLVSPAEVEQVSSLFDLTARIAAAAGQGSVGALLLLVSEIHLFAIDGFTFAVSALALHWLARQRVTGSARGAGARTGARTGTRTGTGAGAGGGVSAGAGVGSRGARGLRALEGLLRAARAASPRRLLRSLRRVRLLPRPVPVLPPLGHSPRPGHRPVLGRRPGPGHRPRSGARVLAVRAWPLLRAHPRIGIAVVLHGAALFAGAVSTVGLPPMLVTRFGQGVAGYGLALAATAAGGLVGNLLTGHLPRRGPWLRTYCLAWVVSGLSLAGLGVAGSLVLVVLLCASSGLLLPVAAVTLRARLSRFGPAQRLRLLTVDQTVSRTAATAGHLVLPFAVDAAPAHSFVVAGLLLSALAAAGWWAGARIASPAGEP